ncbi:MAG: ATP-binding cassette domain-containing protein, partial [Myxococcota bacterium]
MGDAIRLRDLRIEAGEWVLVDEVGLDCEAGELLAVVGASGSGKTLTCRSLLGLVDLRPGVVSADLTILA